jgi:hypothetical protein
MSFLLLEPQQLTFEHVRINQVRLLRAMQQGGCCCPPCGSDGASPAPLAASSWPRTHRQHLRRPRAAGVVVRALAGRVVSCRLAPLQTYTQAIRVTNATKAPVEGELRAASSDRYSISPPSFRIKPGEAVAVSIALKVEPKFAARRKAIETGQRDAFFIKVSLRGGGGGQACGCMHDGWRW